MAFLLRVCCIYVWWYWLLAFRNVSYISQASKKLHRRIVNTDFTPGEILGLWFIVICGNQFSAEMAKPLVYYLSKCPWCPVTLKASTHPCSHDILKKRWRVNLSGNLAYYVIKVLSCMSSPAERKARVKPSFIPVPTGCICASYRVTLSPWETCELFVWHRERCWIFVSLCVWAY